jgi:hypothetical protein
MPSAYSEIVLHLLLHLYFHFYNMDQISRKTKTLDALFRAVEKSKGSALEGGKRLRLVVFEQVFRRACHMRRTMTNRNPRVVLAVASLGTSH